MRQLRPATLDLLLQYLSSEEHLFNVRATLGTCCIVEFGSRKVEHHGIEQEARLLRCSVRRVSVNSKITVAEIICSLLVLRNLVVSRKSNQTREHSSSFSKTVFQSEIVLAGAQAGVCDLAYSYTFDLFCRRAYVQYILWTLTTLIRHLSDTQILMK
jgi:hypothetical protein